MDFDINIADSWKKCRIRDVGEVVTGRTPSTKRQDFYGGEYNLISPADLDHGKYVFTAHKRLSQKGFGECHPLPKHAVLVGCIGSVGKLGILSNDRSATNQQINAIITNQANDPDFVYYCLHANRSRLENAADKTTLPILNKTNFENFEIVVPPLPEQKKIASVLGVAQLAIEQQDQFLRLTTELKRALLHHLFTHGLRGESKKQTDLGILPASWDVVPLSEFVKGTTDFVANGSFASLRENVTYRNEEDYAILLRLLDHSNEFRGPFVYIDENAYRFLAKSRLSPGSVIISNVGARLGTVFRAPDIKKPMSLGPNAVVIRAEEDDDFVFYWFQTVQAQKGIRSMTSVSAQPKFNKTDLRNTMIPVPEKSERDEIAATLSCIDRKLANFKKQKQVYSQLFRTMLHQLMTAQIRVNDLDLPSLEEPT